MGGEYLFLFPGQGAQAPGMAADLVDAHSEAREIFDAGREQLGYDILELCRSGPAEELNSTRVSQPAIFLHSMAVLRVMGKISDSGGDPLPSAGTAGLSLGEYSALVFARVLSFETALRLVVRRGEFMQEACEAETGAMASVLGLPADRVEAVVDSARDRGLRVGIANYNSPSQTVISGAEDAVAATCEELKESGARRIVRLRVAGAYHSPLMASATRKMEALLEQLRLETPRVPFFSNYWGRQVSDPEEIRRGLLRQIENPVRWEQCVRQMAERGAQRALEVGPGKVLQGLVRNIDRSLEVVSLGTLESLDNCEVLAL